MKKIAFVFIVMINANFAVAKTYKSTAASIRVSAAQSTCEPRFEPPPPTRTVTVTTSQNYCDAIKAAQPGDEILLPTKVYTQPCTFTLHGTAAKPIVIRSAKKALADQAQFSCSTCSGVTNFFEIGGEHIVFKDLKMLNNDADIMIRFFAASNVVIENIYMDNIDGQALTANSGNTKSLIIRDNNMKNFNYTVMYFGCHDGSCVSQDILVENNLIDASLVANGTGYAMELKLNSTGTIRDNSFFNAKGPNLMVYGNQNASTKPVVVEGNYFEKSREDASLNIGGGPALVRNNVISQPGGGTALWAQNYAGRNLQRNIEILNNTILAKGGEGIDVSSWSTGAGNRIAGNAIYAATPIQPAGVSAQLQDNVTCPVANTCFKGSPDISPIMLAPKSGGSLSSSITGAFYPLYDFYGIARSPNQVGAMRLDAATENLGLTYLQPRPPRKNRCY